MKEFEELYVANSILREQVGILAKEIRELKLWLYGFFAGMLALFFMVRQ